MTFCLICAMLIRVLWWCCLCVNVLMCDGVCLWMVYVRCWVIVECSRTLVGFYISNCFYSICVELTILFLCWMLNEITRGPEINQWLCACTFSCCLMVCCSPLMSVWREKGFGLVLWGGAFGGKSGSSPKSGRAWALNGAFYICECISIIINNTWHAPFIKVIQVHDCNWH